MKKAGKQFLAVLTAGILIFTSCSFGGNTPESKNGKSESASAASDGASYGEADRKSGKSSNKETLGFERLSILGNSMTSESLSYTPAVPKWEIADDLSNIENSDFSYYSEEVRDMIRKNGFMVFEGSAGSEYFDNYESNRYVYRANFVTVDSMMHTYHLYFAHLLKETEKTYLTTALRDLSAMMLETAKDQYEVLKKTEWANAAKRNVAFFAVGNKLISPDSEVPEIVSDMVNSELSDINRASDINRSAIFEEEFEDYSQYKPRGYYEGDEDLERYFRTMMWYGRRNFIQKDEDIDRSAALITLALSGEKKEIWEHIYTVTSFFAGNSDDNGYYEYRPLLESAFGENISEADLIKNTGAWKKFHELTAKCEPPAINSSVVEDDGVSTGHEEEVKGFRFMGQRFSIDAAVFQRLCYSHTKENANGEKRMLPDALDIPAAFGSDEALDILTDNGDTQYGNYSENMEKLRAAISSANDDFWNASLYSGWLYTLRPILESKGTGYPMFMQNSAWNRKSLMTFLGSYTELKHDTILYSKQMMAEMGGGDIPVLDDRGYVEPEPEVYARLEALCKATSDGLSSLGMISEGNVENLSRLAELSSRLKTISIKELTNVLPSEEEFELIRTYGGQLEHFWKEAVNSGANGEELSTNDFPAAIVADVATDPDSGTCLELGTGEASIIYVVVEVDGHLKLASGTCFSFYQFEQPVSERLTDSEWRRSMGIQADDDGYFNSENSIAMPKWAEKFALSFDRIYKK